MCGFVIDIFFLFLSTSTSSRALCLTLSSVYDTWKLGVVNYDVSQVGKFLFDTIIM